MRCRVLIAAAVALACAIGPTRPQAHAGARLTDPIEGATLGDSPTVVRITFSERPDPSLSSIHVQDTSGATYEAGRPRAAVDDPLTLLVAVRRLDRGVYTVNWRTISAVDGHATTGAYAFGVRIAPAGAAVRAANASGSMFEMIARWVLLIGLVVLLGAAVGALTEPRELALAAAGTVCALLGVALLAEAQRRSAGVPFARFLITSVGRAVTSRAITVGAAGGALLLVQHVTLRRLAVAAAALAAIAVHVAAGHAAASDGSSTVLPVATQSAHFAAVGVWIGGLAALLLAVRGAPSDVKTAAVRRFSNLAAVALVVVLATGVVRAVAELSAWDDLLTSGYGRGVLAKSALLVAIAALGGVNRWRSVPGASVSLQPLRRIGRAELALGAVVLAVAAALGTLAPPASTTVPGLAASGVDFATTVRVRLKTTSVQPGPNRYAVNVADFDSKKVIRDARVSLTFTPIDDPGVAETRLALSPQPDGSYAGSGSNIAFDGRWRVTALVERAGNSAAVPLEVEAQSQQPTRSVMRVPGKPPVYIVQVPRAGLVRFSPDPERPGHSKLSLGSFDVIDDLLPVESIVVTAASGTQPPRDLPMQRVDGNNFVGDIELQAGSNRIVAVIHSTFGTRLRASVDLDVPKK